MPYPNQGLPIAGGPALCEQRDHMESKLDGLGRSPSVEIPCNPEKLTFHFQRVTTELAAVLSLEFRPWGGGKEICGVLS